MGQVVMTGSPPPLGVAVNLKLTKGPPRLGGLAATSADIGDTGIAEAMLGLLQTGGLEREVDFTLIVFKGSMHPQTTPTLLTREAPWRGATSWMRTLPCQSARSRLQHWRHKSWTETSR